MRLLPLLLFAGVVLSSCTKRQNNEGPLPAASSELAFGSALECTSANQKKLTLSHSEQNFWRIGDASGEESYWIAEAHRDEGSDANKLKFVLHKEKILSISWKKSNSDVAVSFGGNDYACPAKTFREEIVLSAYHDAVERKLIFRCSLASEEGNGGSDHRISSFYFYQNPRSKTYGYEKTNVEGFKLSKDENAASHLYRLLSSNGSGFVFEINKDSKVPDAVIGVKETRSTRLPCAGKAEFAPDNFL